MRIAFVDARQKSILFREVAQRLDGEVFWLVQDHTYATGNANELVIPYPNRAQLRIRDSPAQNLARIRSRVAQSDRVGLLFGRSLRHYGWYHRQIIEWIDAVQPQVIFGEAGSFHSHLVALTALERDIPFLNPLSSRYPQGRFAFFRDDRLVPFGGSGDNITTSAAEKLALDIVEGRRKPDYMRTNFRSKSTVRVRARATLEWVRGERFTAQSPPRFLRSKLTQRRVRLGWNDIASVPGPKSQSTLRVLYPLQLQPEMNLDVWGYRFRDQTELVQRLATNVTRAGGELWVKPNPKSSFELSGRLLELVTETAGVFAIPTDTSMLAIADHFDLVVTVSGTVAIERLLARRPVAILLDDYSDWLGVPRSDLGQSLDTQIDPDFVSELASAQRAITPHEILGRLIGSSYPGQVAEPNLAPGVLATENIEAVATAFADVISLVQKAAPDTRDDLRYHAANPGSRSATD